MSMRRVVGAVLGTMLGGLSLTGCAPPSAADRFTDPQVIALVEAAGGGDEAQVRGLVAAGADLDARGEYGYTPLLAMVHTGDLLGVRTVLAAGADRDLALDEGATAVHVAAGRERSDMLELLLDLGFDPSTPNTVTGASPLRKAFLGHHIDTVRVLLDAGTDVNLTDRTAHTPLHHAASINYTDAVLLLLEAGADPTARTGTGATFQTYLFNFPERVLNERSLADRDRVEDRLRELGIPSERR